MRNLPGHILDITPNTVSDEILLNANLEEFQLGVCRGNEIKSGYQDMKVKFQTMPSLMILTICCLSRKIMSF